MIQSQSSERNSNLSNLLQTSTDPNPARTTYAKQKLRIMAVNTPENTLSSQNAGGWQACFDTLKWIEVVMRSKDYLLLATGVAPPAPGSSVCSWPSALIILPVSYSCIQTFAVLTQGSARISSNVALVRGSRSSILEIICLVSRGNKRRRRHGPLITCWVVLSPDVFCVEAEEGATDVSATDREGESGVSRVVGSDLEPISPSVDLPLW